MATIRLTSKSQIHFKDIVKISGYSFSAVINLFAKSEFEPPYADVAELRSEEISASLPKDKIYKIPSKKRKTIEK